MKLLEIERELRDSAQEILRLRSELKDKETPLLTRIEDLQRLKEMGLKGLNNEMVLVAEKIIRIDRSVRAYFR